MNCRKCGAEALDSSLFCRLCGSKVKQKSDLLWRLRMIAIAILLIIIGLAIIASSHAQEPQWGNMAEVTVVNNRQAVRITKMLDKDIYDDCCPTRFTAVGVITNVSYNQADINGFTLKLLQPGAITFDGKVISRPAIGHRQNVDMPGPMQYSNAERGWVETLVKEGMKVRVKGCVCGNGGYWGALEIDLVR